MVVGRGSGWGRGNVISSNRARALIGQYRFYLPPIALIWLYFIRLWGVHAWGSEVGWAGEMDRQEEWMGRERGWGKRVNGAGRVEKTGTVDGAGRLTQLTFFVPLPNFEILHWIFVHFVIHSSLLLPVIFVDNKLNNPPPRRTHVFFTGNIWLCSIFFQCKTAHASNRRHSFHMSIDYFRFQLAQKKIPGGQCFSLRSSDWGFGFHAESLEPGLPQFFELLVVFSMSLCEVGSAGASHREFCIL